MGRTARWRRPPGEQTANELTRQILDYLTLHGHLVWRNNTGRRGGVAFGHHGSPNIIGITAGGKFLGVEVKVRGDRMREDQRAFERYCVARGGLYVLARSFDQFRRDCGKLGIGA